MLTLLFLSCNDISLIEKEEQGLIVAPAIIEFGHLLSGHESHSKEITIANASSDEAVIDHLEIEGENFSIQLDGFTIEPGGYHQVDVGYTPITFEYNEGVVDIYMEGSEEPVSSVWLNGYGDAPVINIDPDEVDFGEPLLGCEMSQQVSIENAGNVDLVIDDVSFMTSIPQELDLDYGTLPEFPWIIQPSSRLTLFINYVPLDEDADTLEWEVDSNDPQTPVYSSEAIGDAAYANNVIQDWIQQTQVIVDIIWVVDNSGSMYPYQQLLGLNMETFMNMFLSFSPDYRMGFITTDTPYLVNGAIIDSTSATPTVDAVTIINSIGARGSGHEQGLDQLKFCLESGDCRTMIRQNSALVVIFLSDEEDHSYLSPIAFQGFIDNYKPNNFIPFAIIGDIPNGCIRPNSVPAKAGYGYYDIVNHYSSKWWSICDTNWGSQMQEVAQDISLQSVFVLDEADPVVETIEVYVNGQLIEEGWSYSEESNAVIFDYDDVPSAGDYIEVSYSHWGCSGE